MHFLIGVMTHHLPSQAFLTYSSNQFFTVGFNSALHLGALGLMEGGEVCDFLNALSQSGRGEAAGKPSSSRGMEDGKEKWRKRIEEENKEQRRGETEGVCACVRTGVGGIVLSRVKVLGGEVVMQEI